MKLKTTIATFVLGFIVLVTLCIRINPSIEGLNTMKTNTHVLRRGEYIDDVGYLKSEDGNYKLMLRNGKLNCFVKTKGTWKQLWSKNTRGSNIMLLNDYGILQFKQSRESEPIIQMSKDANSLVLTSYGTLEMKSGMDGAGTTLWAYPVNEGFVVDDADIALTGLTSEIDTDRGALTHHTINNLDASFKTGVSGGTNQELLGDAKTGWNTFYKNNANNATGPWTATVTDTDTDTDIENDQITGGADDHNTLLNNNSKLKKLRSELDNKVWALNQLGVSHDTENLTNMGSTIYISLVWTVIASSLVYYTFTQ